MDSLTYGLTCSEVWGGNRHASAMVELPGLLAWVYSRPAGFQAGGDVHYLSVCNKGLFSRIALADVSGHGRSAAWVAGQLRRLMHEYMNNPVQAAFLQQLNEGFSERSASNEYATAVVLGYLVEGRVLIYSNAGHLPPLWYRAAEREWRWLFDRDQKRRGMVDMPIGLFAEARFDESSVRLAPGDLVIAYTDGLAETCDPRGEELGLEGLMDIASRIPGGNVVDAGQTLLRRIQGYRGGGEQNDDESLLVLQVVA